jgi:putative ABC transport system permease protein
MDAWRALIRVAAPLATRHLAAQRRVVAVTVFALACGVGATLASQLLYGSVVGSYEATLHRFAGRAALHVTNGTSGVAEEVVDGVRSAPGVHAVAPTVEGFVTMRRGAGCAAGAMPTGGERVYLYGVDLLADRAVHDYDAAGDAVVEDPLVFLASPDSVALTASLARDWTLGLGDSVCVLTPDGFRPLTVRALLGRQRGPASALDGRLAVVDLSVAQELLGMSGRVSSIAVVTGSDTDPEVVARAVGERVAGHGVVEPPRSRAASFGRLLANYRVGLSVAAVLAMLVALAFVSGVASLSVAVRQRELGLLRVIGLRRREVAAVVAVEILALGVVASAIGVLVGIGLARMMVAHFGAGADALYGGGGHADLRLDATSIVTSLVGGVLVPLVAAIGPLRRAARVAPLAALALAGTADRRTPRYGVMAGAGVASALLVLALWALRSELRLPVRLAGVLVMIGTAAGAAACVPALVHALLAWADRRVFTRGRGFALLACRELRSDARAIAVTCAALLLALAGGIGVSTWIASLDATLRAAFDTAFMNVDAVVSAGDMPYGTGAIPMPPSIGAGIADLPGVAFADAVRVDTIAFEDAKVQVVASDVALHRAGRRRFFMVEGDADAAVAEVAAGAGALVNRSFARRFGRRPGERLTLATPTGPLSVRIAGIHLDLTPGDLGIVRLDRALYRRWWRDAGATAIEVSLHRPEDGGRVIDAIRARWGASHGLVVLTLAEVRREYGALLRRLAVLVYPLVAVALTTAAVGTVAGRAASMLARRRATGLLRAVGMTRRQLARLFAIETAVIASLAAGAAVMVGAVLGRLQVAVLLEGMLGMSVVHAYPHGIAWVGGAALIAGSAVTGWVFGYRTGRVTPCAALRWE